MLRDDALAALFACAVEATEEAVLNALWFARDVHGRDGRLVRALPHDDVYAQLASFSRLELCRRCGRRGCGEGNRREGDRVAAMVREHPPPRIGPVRDLAPDVRRPARRA